jgi:hypothetical protein
LARGQDDPGGRRPHLARPGAFDAKDRARDRAAAREGWLTLRVLDDEVRHLPAELIDDLVVTYGSRIALLDAERGANGR